MEIDHHTLLDSLRTVLSLSEKPQVHMDEGKIYDHTSVRSEALSA